ncbi:MAG: sugar transferase [Lachnospiraceae bacterium]
MQQEHIDDVGKHIRLERKCGFYELYIKRLMDIVCSLAAIIVFSWLYIIVAVLVRVKLGSPVLFKQPRPGKIDPKTGREKIFYMYKFRSMSDERDENGNLLPDDVRLGKFGKALRATSLDELPEAFNILKGDMSIIGPRPQLVRDMVFMTDEQRVRHTAKPGLSGLAQTRGRNALSWDAKLATDLEYIENISFLGDVKIIVNTVKQVFFKEKGIEGGMVDEVDITDDFGDYLLKVGRVSKEEYDQKMNEAKESLEV